MLTILAALMPLLTPIDLRCEYHTNPPAIDGNNRPSLSADDDGGLFRELARRFYRRHPPRL